MIFYSSISLIIFNSLIYIICYIKYENNNHSIHVIIIPMLQNLIILPPLKPPKTYSIPFRCVYAMCLYGFTQPTSGTPV